MEGGEERRGEDDLGRDRWRVDPGGTNAGICAMR